MKRFVLLAIVACFLLGGLSACACEGAPTLTLRNPFQLDREAATVAGPRMRLAPQYLVPQYVPAAAPAGAAPCTP